MIENYKNTRSIDKYTYKDGDEWSMLVESIFDV